MGLSTRTFSGSGKHRLCCLLCAFAMVFAGLPLAPRTAYADRTETVSNPEYEAALERLNSINAEYDALAAEQDATLTQLEDVRSQIAENEAQAAELQQQIDDRQVELAQKQEALASHVSADYKSGGMNLLSVVLSASSFEEAVSRFYYFNAISEAQVAEIDEINVIRADLANRQQELKQVEEELGKQEEDLENLYEQKRAQTEQIEAQQVEAAEILASLPMEIVITIAEEPEELLGTSELVLEAEEQKKQEQQASQSNNNSNNGSSNNSNNNSNNSSNNNSNNNSNNSSNNNTPADPAPAAGGSLQALLDTAYSTGPTRADWGCAGWVYVVFKNSGVYGKAPSCAAWYYDNWCYTSDRSQIRPGMVIAVNNTGGSAAGRRYGHCGIYVGNNTVRHFTHGAVQEMSLDRWIRNYGSVCTPRWGWNGGIVLS
ncbi:MAG: hypothetical protein IKG69_05710 [Atopobiaceae bacterium]|nr:hypothetical protein [Atopobiaceae bacterium]